MKPYERGQIKVVWIEEDNLKIYSKMFNDVKQAKKFAGSKKDYVIFALIHQKNMEEFTWKLLPYGKYKIYLRILEFYRFFLKQFSK